MQRAARELCATAGEFDIEIRNSRDDEDTVGVDPLVTRLVIGGTEAEAGIRTWAAASSTDPGNFTTDDEAIVLLDQLAGRTLGNINRDLNQYGVAAGSTKAELVGRALGRVGVHELGHTFGCAHTNSANTVFDAMDRLGLTLGFDPAGTGPDRIFGTADDRSFGFGVDEFETVGVNPLYRGVQDTLNRISFGLATGTN